MWGQSASDYYAIGRGGLFRHFDGVEWSAALLSETRWRGIGGISPDDAWAVGRAGAMARRTADGWALVEDMGLIADLYDVLAVSGSDVWVVGRDATVLHFDGTAWSPVDVGAAATTDFKAIASNGSLIAISGRDDSYESVVFTYDGTTWTKLPFSSNGPMLGLHVTATGEIWSIAKQNSMVMHWDGTQWESFDLRALSGTYGKCHDLHYRADDSIYVACGGSQDGRPIWHYNGVDWVRMEWNLYGTARKLIDFGGKLYAGGARGVLAAFDRRGYLVQDRPVDSTVQPAVDLYMYGVSLVDRAMAITATNKGAAVWNGVTWTHSNLGTYTRAPCAIAKNLGYVAAGNGILYKYNGSTWQSLTMPAPMNTTSAQYMKASGPDNVWAASSSGGRAAQWNGTSWTGHTVTLPSSTRDLETFASNDTWISGYVGGLSHWDGTEWTADTFFTDMMEPPTVYSLGGVSSTDLYAGTSAGIYHRDAAGWSKLAGLPDTDTYYRYIVANRADDVYALLTSGNPRLYHYDGTAWTLIRSRIPAMSYMDAADGVVTIADSQGVDTLVEID
jgi:hypothetical protein